MVSNNMQPYTEHFYIYTFDPGRSYRFLKSCIWTISGGVLQYKQKKKFIGQQMLLVRQI